MKTLYRYELQYSNSEGDVTDVHLIEYPVIRETECNYLIKNPRYSWFSMDKHLKRVSKNAYNTFAYDTKEKAKEHFIRRTSRRIDWFEYWMDECKKGLEIIKTK